MLFSVCIPVYNTSMYLDECIQSVLSQTEKDYEIILVNDGSTDNSGEICDRYAAEHSNIRVIHKENEGLMMTRRRAFREAGGEYFICLDSDDALNDADALRKIRRSIEDNHADLVIYEYIYASELHSEKPDRYISLFEYPDGYVFSDGNKHELYEKLLLGKYLNAIWIKAAARHLVDLDTDYSQWRDALVNSQGEDLLQTLPILDAAERVAYLKEPLYFYRWNPDSISRNVRPEYYFAYRTIYQRTDLYLQKWEFDEESVHRIMQGRLNMIFGVLLAEKHPDRDKWLQVLRQAADDPFFHELWEKRDSAYVCRYYMMMGALLLKKRFITLQIAKKTVEMLVKLKKRIRKRSA